MDKRRRTPREMMEERPVQGENGLEDTMMEEGHYCEPEAKEDNLRPEDVPNQQYMGGNQQYLGGSGMLSTEAELRANAMRAMRLGNDPWDHNKLRCGSCMWFKPKTLGHVLGRCRRRAPTLSGFPVVSSISDWCGDHKIVE